MKNLLLTNASSQVAWEVSKCLGDDCFVYYINDTQQSMISNLPNCKGYIDFSFNDKVSSATLVDFVLQNSISYILPLGNVFELTNWSIFKNSLLDQPSIKIIVNDTAVISNSFDKLTAYNMCKKNGVLYPKLYRSNSEIDYFPLVIKSRQRSSSTKFALSMKDVQYHAALAGLKDLLVQKHIEGQEIKVFFINTTNGFCLFPISTKDNVCHTFQPDDCLKSICNDVISIFGADFGVIHLIVSSDNYFLDLLPSLDVGILALKNAGVNIVKVLIEESLSVVVNNTKQIIFSDYSLVGE